MEIIETNFSYGAMATRTSTRRIIVHHAAAINCSAEDIHRWHLQRGYAGAGYHFLVRKDGTIYRLRPEDKVGAHAYGSNYDSIGICAEGNFMEENMPDVQKEVIKWLVAELKRKYNISAVQPHRAVCNTSCPGNNYPLSEIVNAVNTEVVVSKPTPEVGRIGKIQQKLNEKYGVNIAVDNIYGNETRKALVKGLQKELNTQYGRNLAIDGIFGNATYNACVTVKNGARGNITWLLQAMLVCHSFDLNADGIFGNNTEATVRSFQRRNELTADGIAGRNTFSKLCK